VDSLNSLDPRKVESSSSLVPEQSWGTLKLSELTALSPTDGYLHHMTALSAELRFELANGRVHSVILGKRHHGVESLPSVTKGEMKDRTENRTEIAGT
jgi:hypothetical protein